MFIVSCQCPFATKHATPNNMKKNSKNRRDNKCRKKICRKKPT